VRYASALHASRVAVVVLGTVLAATGCRSATSPQAAATAGSLTVYAASSLTTAFTALGKQFETDHPGTTIVFNFGASSALARQIIAGAPADVFASASTANMKQVTDAQQARAPKTFATNVAEIAVAPASAARVHAVADLAAPGLRVALCQPEVPCGALAHTVLAKAHVEVTPATEGLDVKSTLAYVTNGSADAAIVYVTDVRAAGSAVTGIEIPADVNASTAYPIAVVTATKNASLAGTFEDYVLSGAGQATLAAAGFRAP
jgi:molybdate transport system substrate-binding protein